MIWVPLFEKSMLFQMIAISKTHKSNGTTYKIKIWIVNPYQNHCETYDDRVVILEGEKATRVEMCDY